MYRLVECIVPSVVAKGVFESHEWIPAEVVVCPSWAVVLGSEDDGVADGRRRSAVEYVRARVFLPDHCHSRGWTHHPSTFS